MNNNSGEHKALFLLAVKNEMPEQTFLETAIKYYVIGRNEEAGKVLSMTPQNTEVLYWEAYLENKALDIKESDAEMVFPFRRETTRVLQHLIKQNSNWLLNYHLALIEWNNNNLPQAKKLFTQIGDKPHYPPFYAARAELYKDDSTKSLADLNMAAQLDKSQWRFGQGLVNCFDDLLKSNANVCIAICNRLRVKNKK